MTKAIVKTNPVTGNYWYREYKKRTMKNKIARVRTYAYYYIGDLISKLMYLPGLSRLYHAYQWCMRRSIDIQDRTKCNGPWRQQNSEIKR